MNNKIFFITILILFFSCKNDKYREEKNSIIPNQKIEIVDFKGLESFLNKNDDKTYIINFWATWCKPCIEELPYFQELENKYPNKDLKILLVSLDFPEKLKEKLIPFVEKHKIASEIVLLDAPNENEWIPKIDSTWSGAIPATLIYNKNKRAFYEQSFTKETLFKEVNKFIKI